jgi:hypothetical protein
MFQRLCQEIIQRDEYKQSLSSLIVPVKTLMWNEMYIYIWILCIYMILITFIIFANLFLLVRVLQLLHETSSSAMAVPS